MKRIMALVLVAALCLGLCGCGEEQIGSYTVLEEIGTGLSEQERRSFYSSLSIISDALDAIANNGGAQAVRN